MTNFFNTEGNILKENVQNKYSNMTDLEEDNLDLVINESFKMQELDRALGKNKSSSPGFDNIPYEIYNNLPKVSKELLLKLMNMT